MRNGEGTGGGTAGDTVEAAGCVHERVHGPRFAEPVSASHGLLALRDGSDDDDDYPCVEITLDVRDDSVVVVKQETLEKRPPLYSHSVLSDAPARVEHATELRRLTSSGDQGQGGRPSSVGRSMAATAHALTFLSRADASAGWAAVERRFDEEAKDGLLHRPKFAKCIGMKEIAGDLAFAGELFDALARRRHISGDSISKPELLEFWDQISGRSFDGRLHVFFDMGKKRRRAPRLFRRTDRCAPARAAGGMGDAAGGEMVCEVCLSRCNHESKGSGFSIYVWEEFKNAAVVPCNERGRFNDMTGEKLTFEANKQAYTVWERLEKLCWRQQSREGSARVLLPGPTFS